MARYLLLDAGVIGLLTSSPDLPDVIEGVTWLQSMISRYDVATPDIADYEVRREQIRVKATRKLARLAELNDLLLRVEITKDAWLKASEFWALVRQAGTPTAHPVALDADAILAGVAATLGMPGDQVIIATTNPRHLVRFPGVEARDWREIGRG